MSLSIRERGNKNVCMESKLSASVFSATSTSAEQHHSATQALLEIPVSHPSASTSCSRPCTRLEVVPVALTRERHSDSSRRTNPSAFDSSKHVYSTGPSSSTRGKSTSQDAQKKRAIEFTLFMACEVLQVGHGGLPAQVPSHLSARLLK